MQFFDILPYGDVL